MMTLKEASAAVGMHKVSLLRAIRKGKVSAVKDEHGEWQIQEAELFRVYDPVAEQRSGSAVDNNNVIIHAALEAEIAGLKAVNELLRQEVDRWHAQAERLAITGRVVSIDTTRPPWWRRLAG